MDRPLPGASQPVCAQMIETLGVGGAENLAVRVANGLAEKGWNSHLVVLGDGGPLTEFVAPDVHLHVLNYSRASIKNPLGFLLSIRRGQRLLAGLIRTHGIQVVQSHLPGSNFWGLLLAMTGSVAVFPTIHNNKEFNYGEADQPLRKWLRHQAYRRMLSTCRGLIAVSEKVKTSFGQELGLQGARLDPIIAVPNGVPLTDPVQEVERRAIRARHGLLPGQLVGLAAGRFCEQKNFGDLVQAAVAVCREHPEFVCFIAGDGHQRAELSRVVAEMDLAHRILMPGNVFDLPDLMSAADIFILPSLWEGLPLVLLEAMGSGLPVAGNRVPGILDIIEDGKNGLLAEPGDPEDLVRTLGTLVRDATLRAELARAGREMVARDYSLDRIVTRLDAVYRSAL